MKKRDPIKQNKLQKKTTKRALYEKARKKAIIAKKNQPKNIDISTIDQ